MAVVFDKLQQLIIVESPDTEVTIQELVDAIREWEDELSSMDIAKVANASGKEDLGGGTLVGITLELIDWKLQFEARPGPEWVLCGVAGGNLVAVDDLGVPTNAIEPSAFVTVNTTSSSSATLQEIESIQYSSFNGGVTVDTANGVAGTTFPVGTLQAPVDNIVDAVTIANERGFNQLFILGNLTLTTGDVISEMLVHGENANKTVVTIDSGADVGTVEFHECMLTGALDGGTIVRESILYNVNMIDGVCFNTMMAPGTVSIHSTQDANFLDCYSGLYTDANPVVFDMDDSSANLILRNYAGDFKVVNHTGGGILALELNGGTVVLDSTVSTGLIKISGVGQVVDESTGTAVLDTSGLVNTEYTADKVWNADLSLYPIEGSAGESLANIDVNLDTSGLSTFDPAVDQVIVEFNNDKTGYELTEDYNLTLESITEAVMTSLTPYGTVVIGRGMGSEIVHDDLDDVNGIPLKRVSVMAFWVDPEDGIDWDRMRGMDVTNEQGQYTMYLDPGQYVLAVQKAGVDITTLDKTVVAS